MFRYSDKGKRLMDLVIGETKGKVEKVMEIEGRVGREWVVVKEGELGIGKIERVKTTKEGKVMEKLNICRTYSVSHLSLPLSILIHIIQLQHLIPI